MSSKCINRNVFETFLVSLDSACLRIESLDLSFNQFFKSKSLDDLVKYLEKKTVEIMDANCKDCSNKPALSTLK